MNKKHQTTLAVPGTVLLRGLPVAIDSEPGKSFISDCARNTEGLLSDLEVMTRHGLSVEDWAGLAVNAHLLDAVRATRDRRIVSGEAAREAAQRHFAKAPDVLGGILADDQISPRHRIEAAKELRQVAGNGPGAASAPTEKFIIHIDLGADEKFVYEANIGTRPPSLIDYGE